MFASKSTKHCDVLTKILYIWGKINPTVRYVQGYIHNYIEWTKF